MKFGVVVFPGSNCDHDTYHVISKVLGQPVNFIWHKTEEIGGHDAIILPGGFSFGDYQRPGSIARFSPVMSSVIEFAGQGGLVLGIGNGFQILCAAGLLPGTLRRNRDQKFRCAHVEVRVEQIDTPFTRSYQPGQILSIPVAHGAGDFFCDEATLSELEREERVIFRYASLPGEIADSTGHDDSLQSIAGICNQARNVLGLMPHPERAAESVLGSNDGRTLFLSMVEYLNVKSKARS